MSHFISLQNASEMTARYRAHRLQITIPGQQGIEPFALSETFDRSAIDTLLVQPGCTSLRIYYGMDEDLNVHAILVASDEDNADILGSVNPWAQEEQSVIVEMANRCPPLCPQPSELNQ
ncbi:hypothetical protein U0035_03430 [Niabella yanshanensis]|uniref:Uncharacterized protein n=1 Tax=Niabella yanshanensis TaxID=577386 RepID=A0ABZ0W7E9_9BACT|nr:hypothetical protein [Niabella yanshanensis]WQD39200.1 hypothetical protein U0035_03430 [Niabella yanshanensis]